jgi:hypothetical protein
MASLIFNSFFEDLARGAIDMDTDAFKIMLVTSAYAPDKDAHLKRSQVTNEVANGNGYTTGGQVTAVTVTKDVANDRLDMTFGNPAGWPTSTFTARAGVIYKSRGGASSADELVAYLDFGADITATNGTFSVSITSPLRIQN